MSGLNQQDLAILREYAAKGNRELYWNYLAQKPGNDGYGLLALGVVRNDNMPGVVANQYAQNQALSVNGIRLSEREWDGFGIDLIQRDFKLRELQLAEEKRPDLALNLPAKDVQKAHDGAFEKARITVEAWTPRQLLEAARRQGGEPAADRVWDSMLDSSQLGMTRLAKTLDHTARQYNDPHLDAGAYMGRLTLATAGASHARSHTDPHTVGALNLYHTYDAMERAWYTVNGAAVATGGWGAIQRVRDPDQIKALEDTRALRQEQRERAREFHPQDPYRQLARSPRTLAVAGPEREGPASDRAQQAQAHAAAARLPVAAAPAEAARSEIDVLFDRLTDAAMAQDMEGMRAVGREYLASEDGQQWLQMGREHNQAQREANEREAARQAEWRRHTHSPLEHEAPVMRM
jgi:hypothetical protein